MLCVIVKFSETNITDIPIKAMYYAGEIVHVKYSKDT